MKKTRLIGLLLLLAVLIPTASANIPTGWTHEDIERGYQLDTEKSVTLTTTIVNPHLMYKWSGVRWVYNTPTILVVDGRTWVIYG